MIPVVKKRGKPTIVDLPPFALHFRKCTTLGGIQNYQLKEKLFA
jgi:hypothetical protein